MFWLNRHKHKRFDSVPVSHDEQGLRKALNPQYSVLQTLRAAIHLDTVFSKVTSCFGRSRFHLTPTGVTVSDTSLSRHEQKVARLYERGASTKRIWAYRLRWLAWGLLAVVPTASVASGLPVGSYAIPDGGNSYHVSFTHIATPNNGDYPYGGFSVSQYVCIANASTFCVTNCESVVQRGATTLAVRPMTPFVVSSATYGPVGTNTNDLVSKYCLVKDGIDKVWAIDRLPATAITTTTAADRIQTCLPTDIFSPLTGCRAAGTTSIPAYGPFAYIASFLGLLWFARRRKRR